MENLVINNDKVDCIVALPSYSMEKRKGRYAEKRLKA